MDLSIKEAKINAITDLQTFGIYSTEREIDKCEMEINGILVNKVNTRNGAEEHDNEEDDDEDTPLFVLPNDDIGSDDESLESSAFVKVTTAGGKQKKMRKSHLVWLLKRVQNTNRIAASCRRQLDFNRNREIGVPAITKYEQIQISDWCVFCLSASSEFNTTNNNKYVLGNILSFKYIEGKNEREKSYTWDFAPVVSELPRDKQRGINVLALWFEIVSSVTLTSIKPHSIFYINIDAYFGTFANIDIQKIETVNDASSMVLDRSCFEAINKLVDRH